MQILVDQSLLVDALEIAEMLIRHEGAVGYPLGVKKNLVAALEKGSSKEEQEEGPSKSASNPYFYLLVKEVSGRVEVYRVSFQGFIVDKLLEVQSDSSEGALQVAAQFIQGRAGCL